MSRKIRRALSALVVLLIAVIGIGAAFEAWSRHAVKQRFPPQGRMIDIGGRRLQIDCRGTGSPVVIFESGLDANGSLSWYRVQDSVAAFTRACSYSRAGILWSDPASGPRDGAAIAVDLHRLLQSAGERSPYALVGHSMGGPYVVTFTQRFGPDVAGLVLIDPSHPQQFERSAAITGEKTALVGPMLRARTWLAWTGLNRIGESPSAEPDEALRIIDAYRPVSRVTELAEADAIDATFAGVASAHDLGARPLIVLSGAKIDFFRGTDSERRVHEDWIQMHIEEATWSSAGRHELVANAGHRIQFDDPDAVVRATRSVVDAIRADERLSGR
jgi:pimeloyl-ACP methyl ester carboxylesterase